jgi:hypothetical protein
MNKKLNRREKFAISRKLAEIQKVTEKKISGIIIIASGIVFLVLFGYLWMNRNFQINQSDIIHLQGRIAYSIQLNKSKFSYNSMVIRLSEFPNIRFRVDRFGVNFGHVRNLALTAKIGDTIYLDVSKSEYAAVTPTSNSEVSVYGIRDSQSEYLQLKEYNYTIKAEGNSIGIYLLLAFSFCMLAYGIFLVAKSIFFLKNNKIDG